MDDLCEDERDEPPAVRMHLVDVFVHLFALFANLSMAFKAFWEGLSNETLCHSKYKIERDTFAAEAGRELEKLWSGDTDG